MDHEVLEIRLRQSRTHRFSGSSPGCSSYVPMARRQHANVALRRLLYQRPVVLIDRARVVRKGKNLSHHECVLPPMCAGNTYVFFPLAQPRFWLYTLGQLLAFVVIGRKGHDVSNRGPILDLRPAYVNDAEHRKGKRILVDPESDLPIELIVVRQVPYRVVYGNHGGIGAEQYGVHG